MNKLCILIVKRGGAEPLSDGALEKSFLNNPDGAGFAGVNVDDLGRRKMVVYHSMDFEPWLHKLRRFEKNNPNEAMIIHTRIGTSGEESTLNCHPFLMRDGGVMAHNGIISKARKDPSGLLNDTQMFLKDTIEELPRGWLGNSATTSLVEEYIGMSKLAFLNINGEYAILNDELGSWSNGSWYSNDSYKREPFVYKAWKKPVTTKGSQQIPYKWTFNSPVTCDRCSGKFNIFLCTCYDVYSTIDIYCKDCEKGVLDDGVVYPNEMCKYGVYLDFKNGLPTRYEEDFGNLGDTRSASGHGWGEHASQEY